VRNKEHLKATKWKSQITKNQKKFLFHLIFKLCIKLLCQLWSCYACTCKVKGLRTPSLWIIDPSFVNQNYLVNLQLTLLKCNENSNNWRNPSVSWFGELESQEFVMWTNPLLDICVP
jgi:hypothetical protein